MNQQPILQIDEQDDLIVALQPLNKGESFTINGVTGSPAAGYPHQTQVCCPFVRPRRAGNDVWNYGR